MQSGFLPGHSTVTALNKICEAQYVEAQYDVLNTLIIFQNPLIFRQLLFKSFRCTLMATALNLMVDNLRKATLMLTSRRVVYFHHFH